MAGKVGAPGNHLPLFPPMLPPPERPITPAYQSDDSSKVKGKSRPGGTGSQKIGTHDPQPMDGGVGRQLPDAVQQKPQQQGFTRQDSFRADEVKQATLQQQTVGQGPKQKQAGVVRSLSTATAQQPGFGLGDDVSGSRNRTDARSIERNGVLADLQERNTPNTRVDAHPMNDNTVRETNPLTANTHVASEITQQVTAPAVNALSSLLQDTGADPTSQMNAANSLGQLKEPEASPALFEAAYNGGSWEVREAAKQALAQFPEQAQQFMQKNFDTLSPEAQSAALDHLSRKPDQSAVQTFLAATESPNADIRHKGLKKLESAVMYERGTGQSVFGEGNGLRQQVANTAARLARDSDPNVSAKASDLLYHL